MKKIIFLMFVLNIFGQVHGQTDSLKKEKTFQRYTWDIGTDARPLVYGGNSATIFLRKNFSKITKDSKIVYKATRLGLTFRYRQPLPSNNLGNIYGWLYEQNSDIFLEASFGKEYQKSLGKFQFFYGWDLLAGFEKMRYYYPLTTKNEMTSKKIDFWSIQTRTFVGFKYFLHPRFMLSWEASFHLQYRTATDEIPDYYYFTRQSQYSANVSPIDRLSFHFFF